MKNKFLVAVLTVFGTVLLYVMVLNIFDSKDKKTFLFNRNFSRNENILSFDKQFDRMNKEEFVKYLYSDGWVVEHDKVNIDNKNNGYTLYFSDYAFKKKKTKKVILPVSSNILLCNANELYFTHNFLFYKYDFQSDTIIPITIKGLKVFAVRSIPESHGKLICFGELLGKTGFKSGFFTIDIAQNAVADALILETTPETSMPKNALAYSGSFTTDFENHEIAYTCDKYSRIFFFDKNGKYKATLKTKDNTPLPEILTNQQGDSFYSRGGTWSSNMGTFLKGDKIFVFSARSKEDTRMTLDEYSLKSLKYVGSYKINYNNLDSKSIRNIFIQKDKVLIGFEFYYASFIFSRYI